MSAHLTLDGLPSVEAAFEGVPGAVRRDIMRVALRPAAELIKTAIQGRAHFGPHSRGDRGVKGSIKIQETQIGGEPSVLLKPDARKGGGGRHAHLVEFDTKAHASKYYGNPSKHPGTKGQPFFQPAVDATEDQAMELMERSIGEQLEAYWNRQGGGQ